MSFAAFDLRSLDRQTLFYNANMAGSPKISGQTTPDKASHLVVLVHGLARPQDPVQEPASLTIQQALGQPGIVCDYLRSREC